MKRIVVDGLPDDPLAAAGVFHQHWLAHVEATLGQGEDVMLQLPAITRTGSGAAQSWRGWHASTHRFASILSQARAGAAANRSYLAAAPGVTGQYLEV